MEEDKEINIDDELLSEMDEDIRITIYHPDEDPNSDFITKCKSGCSSAYPHPPPWEGVGVGIEKFSAYPTPTS